MQSHQGLFELLWKHITIQVIICINLYATQVGP